MLVASAALAGAAGGALAASAGSGERATAARRAPVVRQMVVFRSGRTKLRRVRARGALVRVGHRRCAVARATPLAALVRSRPGRIRLRDYGSCSLRARDGGGLFVRAIGRNRNKGRNGWVYKVGRKAGTAGAADPTGPFGHGRLRSGRRVVWFFCFLRTGGCQRSLELRAQAEAGGIAVRAVGYDDEGHGVYVGGATVRAGPASAVTSSDGTAHLGLPPGTYRVAARKHGLVRSFPQRVVVK
ncbi:MAG: hypothetical protein ABR581_00680 [Thermoleophilaceae bacterium]